MLGLGFLNPMLLWALPLAAVPIVIHLLNRRRFKTVSWAAMEFLIRAMKRNRRRLRMEQWLILLLRTLAVLLVVFVVSRPRLDEGLLGTERRHFVVCLDDSASMAHRSGAGSAFDGARARIVEFVAAAAERANGDLLTLLRASRPERPDLSAARITPELATRVRELTAGLTVADGTFDVSSVLAAAGALAADVPDADRHEFRVLTDFRRVDWSGPDGQPVPGVAAWLRGLDPAAQRVTIGVVGGTDESNLAVVGIRCTDRVCTVGVPLTFSLDVENRGPDRSQPSELMVSLLAPDSFRADGEVDPRSQVAYPVPPLGPGERASIDVVQTYREPGGHAVSAALPADRYSTDDLRALAFDVRARSRVWLIDGDPGDEPEAAETFFVGAAYDVNQGIEARFLAAHDLASLTDADWEEPDLVWLCNVARPDEAAVARLTAFVERGGGLVVCLGNQTDVAHYARVMWNDGAGLLVNEPIELRGDIDDPKHVHLAGGDHPLFARYAEVFEFLFGRHVLVGRYVGIREDPRATTLLRFDRAAGDPLLTIRALTGGGHVLVLATSADAHWTNLPAIPAFAPLCNEIHRVAARPQLLDAANKSPFDALVAPLDPAVYRPDAVVVGRDMGPRTVSAATSGGGTVLTVAMAELHGYGAFGLLLTPHAGGAEVRPFTRNPILREGELAVLSRAGFTAAYPELEDRVVIVDAREALGAETAVEAGGLWRWLGLCLLAGLLVETVLAWKFGRR